MISTKIESKNCEILALNFNDRITPPDIFDLETLRSVKITNFKTAPFHIAIFIFLSNMSGKTNILLVKLCQIMMVNQTVISHCVDCITFVCMMHNFVNEI